LCFVSERQLGQISMRGEPVNRIAAVSNSVFTPLV